MKALAGIALVAICLSCGRNHEMTKVQSTPAQDAFRALAPQEHLRLATEAFKNEQYVEMDRHLLAIDSNFPGSAELRKQYVDKINKRVSDNRKDEDKKRKKEEETRKAINKLKVPEIGMDENTLYECSWGRPNQINRTRSAYGRSEQWVYETNGYPSKYVYLENGIVTSIQD